MEAMKIRKVGLTAGGKTLAEVKFQRDIFQRDALSLLLFIVAMIPRNYIFRKCTGSYKFTNGSHYPGQKTRPRDNLHTHTHTHTHTHKRTHKEPAL